MITLLLNRQTPKGKGVPGTLIFDIGDQHFEYPTLENADFIIPAGTYPLERTWSPRFKKLLPIVRNVPDREGIRIHMGTLPEHSQGCILTNFAALCQLNVLFNNIDLAKQFNQHEYEEACIIISDPR